MNKIFYISKLKILTVFGFIICLPSLIFIIFRQSSYASGMIVTSIIIILYTFTTVIDFKKTGFLIYSKSFFFIVSLIIVHSIIAVLISISFEFGRMLGSVLILFLMFFAAYGCVIFFNNCSNRNLDVALKVIFTTFCIIVVSGGAFSIIPISQYLIMPKPIFPFMEPSHFAIMFAPYFLWMLVNRKNTFSKILLVIFVSLILVFMSNVTLASVIGLGIILTFGIKKSLLVLPFIAILIIVLDADIAYYSERIGTEGEDNLSNLVWLQGWEEAYLNVEKTNGYGIGFQQFGVQEPNGQAANTILRIMRDYLNRYDGGTFAAKIIGEFGVFGLLFIIWIVRKSYKSFNFLRGLKNNENETILVLYHCYVFYFVIELFVRSLSYMAPGFFMFMVGLLGVSMEENRKRGILLN